MVPLLLISFSSCANKGKFDFYWFRRIPFPALKMTEHCIQTDDVLHLLEWLFDGLCILCFISFSKTISRSLICTVSIDSVMQPLRSPQSIVLKMALTRCSMYGDHLSARSSHDWIRRPAQGGQTKSINSYKHGTEWLCEVYSILTPKVTIQTETALWNSL